MSRTEFSESFLTAVDQFVARLDSYSQADHAEGINAARERADARRAAIQERARAAVARLRIAEEPA